MEKENASGRYKMYLNICSSSPAETLNTSGNTLQESHVILLLIT